MLKSNGKHFDFLFVKGIRESEKEKLIKLFGYSRTFQVGTLFATVPIAPSGGWILSGSAVIDGKLVTGPCEPTSAQAQLLEQNKETSGSFVLIKTTDDEIQVSTDNLGLSQVYFHETNENIVFSNNALLAGALIKSLKKHTSLDKSALATQWVFPNAFGVQLNTTALPLCGLTLLRANERVKINTTSWSVDDTKIVAGLQQYDSGVNDTEYWQLIQQSAEEILSNIDGVISSNAYDRTIVNITGGRDSRMILAAVACLGKVQDVRFKTRFSNQREDDIATGLVGYVGGKYDDFAGAKEFEVDPFKVIKKQIYFKSGLYHDIKFPRHGLDSSASNSVRLIGGCGEIYRTFYTHMLRKQFNKYHLKSTKQNVDEIVSEFFRGSRLWDAHGLPESLKEDAIQMLQNELSSLPGDCLSHRLEAHYLAFRNRFHFGMSTHIPNKEGDIFQPLVSNSLLELARRVPPEVLTSGKLLFDVTSVFSPTIARTAYASSSARSDFSDLPFYRKHPLDSRKVSLPPASHLKEEALMRKRASRKHLSVKRAKRVSKEHYIYLKKIMFDNALDKLMDYSELNGLMNDKLLAKMRWNLAKDGKFSRVWWSRIVSAAEYSDFEITDPLEGKL